MIDDRRMTRHRSPFSRHWRLRPDGRGDEVFVDGWVLNELLVDRLQIGFVARHARDPYPWVCADVRGDPIQPIPAQGAIERLHYWVWERARLRALDAFLDVVRCAIEVRCWWLARRVCVYIAMVHSAAAIRPKPRGKLPKGVRRGDLYDVIHHVNEREADARIANLVKLTASEHDKLHRKTRAQRRVGARVTAGTGWWRDNPVAPVRLLDLYLVRMRSRNTGVVAWLRQTPDGSPTDHENEAGRFLEDEAQHLVQEYERALVDVYGQSAWDFEVVPVPIQRPDFSSR